MHRTTLHIFIAVIMACAALGLARPCHADELSTARRAFERASEALRAADHDLAATTGDLVGLREVVDQLDRDFEAGRDPFEVVEELDRAWDHLDLLAKQLQRTEAAVKRIDHGLQKIMNVARRFRDRQLMAEIERERQYIHQDMGPRFTDAEGKVSTIDGEIADLMRRVRG